MTNILLVYPPFCTPATPPYSITGLYSFLKANDIDVSVLDLNVDYHNNKFSDYLSYVKSLKESYDPDEYEQKTKEYKQEAESNYSKNHKLIRDNNKPELIDELLNSILEQKPKYVGFSVVYSSQVFYTVALIEALKQHGIKTIVGGPAVNDLLKDKADYYLQDEFELLKLFKEDMINSRVLDFSIYNEEKYFSPELVIPIKTTSTCYYKQCAFCTHHHNKEFMEFSMDDIKQTIEHSNHNHFFIIDDMISKKRLLELANIFNGKKWMCQLKPKGLDKETLQILYNFGLRNVIWGVESGNDRVLKLMRKGTNVEEIKQVLKDSHDVGIKNIVYLMVGFPTENKEEFLETIDFLKENTESIDLVSTSVFGLQKDTPIYNNPEKYGIKEIITNKRDVLDDKIQYVVLEGMSNEEAKATRKKFKKTFENINKHPKLMNYFREHLFYLSKK